MYTRVLVVDDDPEMRRLIQSILQVLNLGTKDASNSEEAEKIFKQYNPDVLITDYNMPGKNGRELAQVLRAQKPALKVLIVSGESPELLDGLRNQGYSTLEKPFGISDIKQKLSNLSLL